MKKDRKSKANKIYFFPFFIEQRLEGEHKENNANDQAKDSENEKPKSYYERFIQWAKKQKAADWAGVIINAMLVILTFILLTKSTKTIEVAERSIAAAQEQFRIGNEPFLEINIPQLPDFKENTAVTISPDINNLGKYPCKVKKVKVAMRYTTGQPQFEHLKNIGLDNLKLINTYITSDLPKSFDSRYPGFISTEQSEKIMQGSESLYVWGYISYDNLMDTSENI